MMPTLDSLNSRFAVDNHITFVQQGDLAIAVLQSSKGRVRVALQGAQVLDWLPNGETVPAIWVSDAAVYQSGKGVRGGVPVCWPWFGAGDAGKPAHGFVRTKLWSVAASGVSDAGVWLRLTTSDDEATHALWNHAFNLSLTVTLGEKLTIVLTTDNTSKNEFSITEALHTYFAIGDVDQVRVTGLDGVHYLDKVLDMTRHQQLGDVAIVGEVDRIYVNTTSDVAIVDAVLKRRIEIRKSRSTATVVWNPGSEKEKGFADMKAGDYRSMLCVESGTAGGDVVTIPAGAVHALTVEYTVKRD
ncbi:MAG: D-hexose-6-phosphate mutarotase [Thiotrichales bacterium]|jgi:glucose-6-phosphate 1-epimerase|nr:D-hexose-6-phosphate mutarotase [Thiotrichales bacterium]